jgi:hypothetical protein
LEFGFVPKKSYLFFKKSRKIYAKPVGSGVPQWRAEEEAACQAV